MICLGAWKIWNRKNQTTCEENALLVLAEPLNKILAGNPGRENMWEDHLRDCRGWRVSSVVAHGSVFPVSLPVNADGTQRGLC